MNLDEAKTKIQGMPWKKELVATAILEGFAGSIEERLLRHQNQDGTIPMIDLKGLVSELSKRASEIAISFDVDLSYDSFISIFSRISEIKCEVIKSRVSGFDIADLFASPKERV